MSSIIYYICIPFGYLLKWCYQLVGNYGVAIILFTLATKIVLMPISVWIQKNSILMVKIQPEVNFLKAEMQGNVDAIADGQSKLFKREHYHPMLSLIPLILQIVLLLGVVQAIYNPLSYLFATSNETIAYLAELIGANPADSMVQLNIIEAIKSGNLVASDSIAAALGMDLSSLTALFDGIASFNTTFLGMNLSTVPSAVWGWYVVVPIVAGLSSWLMCFTQNISNVIQHEQGKLNKYGIMTISVLLSLYLGLFVPAGIALYWTASNLLSIAVMYLLNWLINPKKYVDYAALEESRAALAAAKEFGKIDKKDPLYKLSKKREKIDYKAFRKVANKHIVFYSEKSGFYKYYKDLIAELLKRSNMTIHYVTNDYHDQIFEIAKNEPRIKPYYISLKKTVVLMMLVEADMFIMTTPDLNKYYLKRSYIKRDIEYVYAPHDMMSSHYGFQEGAFNAFDTILCVGPHFVKETRETEKAYGLPEKKLVEFGFPFADQLVEDAQKVNAQQKQSSIKEILIAPSWQEDNLLESCLDELIEGLCCDEYHITVRPHPEFVKRYALQMDKIVQKYKDFDPAKLSFELDFSNSKSIYASDLLITDWSGIAPEFCFATKRPAIFVNTKPKCQNQNWEKINCEPVEFSLRKELGVSLNKDELKTIKTRVEDLFEHQDDYRDQIKKVFDKFIFNHGCSAQAGAKYILNSLLEKSKKQKGDKKC